MRFGFCNSGNYTSQNPLMDAEQLFNWYNEQVESPGGRTQFGLMPAPGLKFFCLLAPNLPSTRGACTVNGRTFWVAGTHLFETLANAAVADYGPASAPNNNIIDDGLPVTMVAGGATGGAYPSQLLICSGGTLTVFSLVTNSYVAIAGQPNGVLMVDYLDGFFIALTNANDFFVSNAEDATNWPGLSVSQVSVYSDALLSLIATNRLLWVFGGKRAVAYYNAGNPVFPFSVANGGFMEVGIAAQFSVVRVALASGTTVCWLGGDERGAGVAFAANGFIPQRISDHAFEYWMSQNVISDAQGLAMQDQGHNFYVLRFPTANATWAYDLDLGFWHRRSSLIAGQQQAHRMRCHTYNFGQHLVGDYASGTVYSMNVSYFSEMLSPVLSMPIIRTRIGPTVSTESKWTFIDEFQVDFETGMGPQPPLLDGFGKPRDPYAMLSVSKDFGKTWAINAQIACGQAGEFKTRAVIRRLGKARQWTFRVTVSDAIKWGISDAFISPTEQSYERLSQQFRKLQ
jgi:hypothetical protein